LKMFTAKRAALLILVAGIIFFVSSLLLNDTRGQKEPDDPNIPEEEQQALDKFFLNLKSGGPSKDGIPPIENPNYLSITDADENIDDNEVVFVVESSDGVFIYRQRILAWHEIVNETFSGEKMSITYCPLTGSAVGFKGAVSRGETTFGTSGKLLNSNLVMYDRLTGSYIPQLLGKAINGNLKGERLDEFPIIWTRWFKAKSFYEEAQVLSEKTGFIRNYRGDPYGSYLEKNNYYDSGGALFPVMHQDNRFEPKEVVMAGRVNETPFAILKQKIRSEKVMNLELENIPLVALYDGELDTVRIFRRMDQDQTLTFRFENGDFLDENTMSIWNERGAAVEGQQQGAQLEAINSFDVMWFAWVAFHPETEVYE